MIKWLRCPKCHSRNVELRFGVYQGYCQICGQAWLLRYTTRSKIKRGEILVLEGEKK